MLSMDVSLVPIPLIFLEQGLLGKQQNIKKCDLRNKEFIIFSIGTTFALNFTIHFQQNEL